MIYRDRFPSCLSCGVALGAVRVGTYSFARCKECYAVLIDEKTFLAMWTEMAPAGAPPVFGTRKEGHAARGCPVCGDPMERVRLLTVPLDRCAHHGLWFDANELDASLAAAALPLESWMEAFTATLRGLR